MNYSHIAAGAAIAAHSAAHSAYKECQDEVLYNTEGSRQRNCAVANIQKLREASELLEKASRILMDCGDRRARMLDE